MFRTFRKFRTLNKGSKSFFLRVLEKKCHPINRVTLLFLKTLSVKVLTGEGRT